MVLSRGTPTRSLCGRAGVSLALGVLLLVMVAVPGPASAIATRPAASGSATRPAASGTSGSWSIMDVPNPTSVNGTISSVSCVASDECEAVGSYTVLNNVLAPEAWAWDGSAWSLQSVPLPSGAASAALLGVSCVGTGFCEAVGNSSTTGVHSPYSPLAEIWNGEEWTAQPTPAGSGSYVSLDQVSCTDADFCEAVGGTTVDQWNGTDWTAQSSPLTSGFLEGVSCTTEDFCEVVGNQQSSSSESPVAFEWDGSAWSTQSVSLPQGASTGGLDAVSCVGTGFCEATGDTGSVPSVATFGATWDGTEWSDQSTPDPSGTTSASLYSLSCTEADQCQAVGEWTSASDGEQGFLTLAESWDGTSWTIQSSPNGSGYDNDVLSGVSCVAGGGCIAAGTGSSPNSFGSSPSGQTPESLIESWDGTSWSLQPSPDPDGYTPSELTGVSCVNEDFCEAVGYYFVDGNGQPEPFAEQWNGTLWTLQSVPLPGASPLARLTGVSCPSTNFCEAVGTYYTDEEDPYPMAEQWDGTSWSAQSVSSDEGYLGVVSCVSSDFCEAAPDQGPTGFVWNGSEWANNNMIPTGEDNLPSGGFAGISCASSSSCEAVGGGGKKTKGEANLYEEQWNGKTGAWKKRSPADAPGNDWDQAGGVTCIADKDCEMVGDTAPDQPGRDGYTSLAEVLHGKEWTIQKTSGGRAFLDGVSCLSASSCEAVGYAFRSGYPYKSDLFQTGAMVWNGKKWESQQIPDPTGAGTSSLYSVSCASDGTCYAVGYYSTTTGGGDIGGYSSYNLVEVYG